MFGLQKTPFDFPGGKHSIVSDEQLTSTFPCLLTGSVVLSFMKTVSSSTKLLGCFGSGGGGGFTRSGGCGENNKSTTPTFVTLASKSSILYIAKSYEKTLDKFLESCIASKHCIMNERLVPSTLPITSDG